MKEAINQIKNKVYATKTPEQVMETQTILAATLVLPDSEVVWRFTDRTHGKRPYKYLDIPSGVHALKYMVPGDRFDPVNFNVNGYIVNNQDEKEIDEAQLEEEIKALKEKLESTSDLLAATMASHDVLEKELIFKQNIISTIKAR